MRHITFLLSRLPKRSLFDDICAHFRLACVLWMANIISQILNLKLIRVILYFNQNLGQELVVLLTKTLHFR